MTSLRLDPAIFRAYDIRGLADRDLTNEVATAVGRAYGTVIARRGGRTVCVGRDCRPHGGRLREALVAGITASGVDVLDVGVVATPLLYFAVHHHDVDGGVQITGSHNPAEYNGFKMMKGKRSLYGAEIVALRELAEAGDFATGRGQVTEAPIFEAYLDHVVPSLTLGPRRLRVVVDGGNGTGGPPAVALLERLGVEVIGMYVPMDGTFPNHHPDPTVEANVRELIARVLAEGADLGVAYDGDADRIGVVDDTGEILWGDRLMILLARAVLESNPGATIVGEVKCSQTLYDEIEAAGGRAIMSKVGHSIIKERMRAEGALLAGEMSGHIFYADRWFGFDDAIYTTGRLVEILSRGDLPLSARLADVPQTCVTPELRLDCPDAHKFQVVERAVAHFSATHDVVDIDGARVQFDGGWGLIRASNTQPVIVLRAEADTTERLAEIRALLEDFVATASAAVLSSAS